MWEKWGRCNRRSCCISTQETQRCRSPDRSRELQLQLQDILLAICSGSGTSVNQLYWKPSSRADWHSIYVFFSDPEVYAKTLGIATMEFVGRQFLSQCCQTPSSLISYQTSPCVWYCQDLAMMCWDGFPLVWSRPRSWGEFGRMQLKASNLWGDDYSSARNWSLSQ